MKRKWLTTLFLAFVMLFCCGVFSACAQTQSEHHCVYDASAKKLQHLDSEDAHDIVAEMQIWATGSVDAEGKVAAPVAKSYMMTYKYELPKDGKIVIGPNMYVGICVNAADLIFKEHQIELTYADEAKTQPISGFYVYNCDVKGCYAMLDKVTMLSKSYIDFFVKKAEISGTLPYLIPAGQYQLTDNFSLAALVADGKIGFANASATEICTNNFEGLQADVQALKLLGVTVYDVCKEEEVDNTTHVCDYIPKAELKSIPLDQKTFGLAMSNSANLQINPNLKTESGNFYIVHLTEDISSKAAFTAPENEYFAICQNGFTFDAPNVKGVYVFDCKAHVCMYDDCNEFIPLHQSGLEFLAKMYKAVYDKELVLPAGDYALMQDFDFAQLPVKLDANNSYNLCLNGYTVNNVPENGLGENISVWDCTQPQEAMHTCESLHPYISAAYLTPEILGDAMFADGVLNVGEREVAFAMTMDLVLDYPLTIPTGTTLHLCLNGFTLAGSETLGKNDDPHIFILQYGAKLHLCDCSEEKTGKVVSATPEMLAANEFNFLSSPILNYGKVFLDGVTVQGGVGVINIGHLEVKDSKIIGLLVGVGTAALSEDDYPLQTKKQTLDVEGSVIEGTLIGVFGVAGETSLEDTVINSQVCGVFNTASFEGMDLDELVGGNGTEQIKNLTIDDVTININPEVGGFGNALTDSLRKEISYAVGVISASSILFEGDLTINVAKDQYTPYVNDNGQVVTPYALDIILPEGVQLHFEKGVELTDEYELLVIMQNEDSQAVIANKDISENFILAEGLAGVLTKDNEYVVVADTDFMSNATVLESTIAVDGYIRLEVYCQFDTNAQAKSFLNNEQAGVIFNVVGQKTVVKPGQMQQVDANTYMYRLDFYAQDYYDQISVQFTDGEYVWTGLTTISVGTFLEASILQIEQALERCEEILATDANEKEIWKQTQSTLPEGSTAVPNFTYSEEKVAEAAYMKENYVATTNAMLAMLNYCKAAAGQFYEDVIYAPLDNSFGHKTVETVVNETTQERTQTTTWTETTLTDAMDGVTAETLEGYRMTVEANSKAPQGVQVYGATLILNSGTYIRCYFKIDESVLNNLKFTINGVETSVKRASNGLYYVSVDNLSIVQLKKMFKISVTDGVDTFTLNYGVFSYMYGVLSNPNADESLVNVAKATWLYADEIEKAFTIIANLPTDDNTQTEDGGDVSETPEAPEQENGEEVNGDANE